MKNDNKLLFDKDYEQLYTFLQKHIFIKNAFFEKTAENIYKYCKNNKKTLMKYHSFNSIKSTIKQEETLMKGQIEVKGVVVSFNTYLHNKNNPIVNTYVFFPNRPVIHISTNTNPLYQNNSDKMVLNEKNSSELKQIVMDQYEQLIKKRDTLFEESKKRFFHNHDMER